MVSSSNFSSWWGRHAVEANRTDLWQIGPLQLWVQSLPHQWKLSWIYGTDWLDSRVRTLPGAGGELPPANCSTATCVFGQGSRDEIVFSPTLPDRPLVTRLTTPLLVLPGEDLNLYVVSPLWLRLEMSAPAKPLHEIPIYRLSDTWFGPMSSLGELCYASNSAAYLDLREVPLRLHCVITAIQIKNSGADVLRLERLNVPLHRLSLFYSPRTGFWTDMISFERREDSEMAQMKLARQPPPDANPAQFIAGPRAGTGDATNMVRAFSALFRNGG